MKLFISLYIFRLASLRNGCFFYVVTILVGCSRFFKKRFTFTLKGRFLNGHKSTEDSRRLETTVIVRMLEEFLYILKESL